MVVIVPSSGLDTCAVSATNASSPRVGICPVPGVCSIESRSGRSHDQSEAGDSVCRPLCTRGAQTCLCNRVAQTWASVPCSSQEPIPTMTGALVAARLGQRPNTIRARQAFTHARILGEHTTNVNSSRALRFFAIGMPPRSSSQYHAASEGSSPGRERTHSAG